MTSDHASLPTLAVTGSTGAVGGMVARRLADAELAQRLLVRSPERAPDLPRATVVRASYADTAETRAALEGVETLFMVSAAEDEHRREQHLAFVDAAAAAGVAHVVYTSFLNASPTATFTLARDHAATERHLEASGMAWTFLRDGLYLDFLPLMMGDDGAIRGPAGQGRAAVIARRDVARVAATVLQEQAAHAGRTYDLTGPQALTFTEMAEILSRHLGRTVTFVDETIEEAYASRASYGAPDWQVEAWVSTYSAVATGEMGPVSNDVLAVTGEPPMSLAQFLAEG